MADQFTAMSAASLNDWYEFQVGYRPQVDDPNMSVAQLRGFCRSYVAALAEEGAEPAPMLATNSYRGAK